MRMKMGNITDPVKIYKFPNGETLIYNKHNLDNSTQIAVGFLGGASLDGNIAGTAHFLEHMLVKETQKILENELNKFFKSNDINSNAFTTKDYIMLCADTPSDNLHKVCKLYSHLLKNNNFNEKSINTERKAIEQEMLITSEENEEDNFLSKHILKGYNKINLIGTKKSLSKIDANVLKNFHDENFVSNNMVIAVVSNLEFEKVKEIVEKSFIGVFKADSSKEYHSKQIEFLPKNNLMILRAFTDVKTIKLGVSYRVEQSYPDIKLYGQIEEFIFNDLAGRLLRKLRIENGLVYDAHFDQLYLRAGLVLKNIYATTSKKHLNKLIDVLGEVINDVVVNGMSEQEYKDFQKMLIKRENRNTKIMPDEPLDLIDGYLDNEDFVYDNQIDKLRSLSIEDINKYLKETYENSNIIFEINGDVDCDKFYDLNTIESKLCAKQSMIYYDENTGMNVIPSSCEYVETKRFPSNFKNLFINNGEYGCVVGNVIFIKNIDKSNKLAKEENKENAKNKRKRTPKRRRIDKEDEEREVS